MVSPRLSLIGATFGLIATLASQAVAQPADYPNRTIRLIVPFSAGGVVDSIARTIGERLAAKYNTPVVIENKAGAGGSIGIEHTAKSPPDGYTLVFVAPGFLTAPSLQRNLSWSPIRDFKGVAGIGAIPNVIVVNPKVPAENMVELIDHARKRPEGLAYGSSGIGTTQHLAGELLAQQADLKFVHVPYKGQPDAIADLLEGRLAFMPLSVGLAVPHIKSGKLRALAVTTSSRSESLPSLPTVEEAAKLAGYEVSTWLGVMAPVNTPEALRRKLSADIAAVLAEPGTKASAAALGLELNVQSGADFESYLAREFSKWTAVVSRAGIAPQ